MEHYAAWKISGAFRIVGHHCFDLKAVEEYTVELDPDLVGVRRMAVEEDTILNWTSIPR